MLRCSALPAQHASNGRHASLSTVGGEETHAAHTWAKSPFQALAGTHEGIPCSGRLFGSCNVFIRLEGQNHADGPAAVSQDVRGPCVSHAPQDAGRMRL